MNKILTTAFFCFLTIYTVSGQLYKHHDWEKKPTFIELSEEDNKLHSVAIKEKYLIQYYSGVLGNTFRLFETKHSIIRINTDKGINKHNRVYIPTRNVLNVIDIKARVVQKNGSTKYLNKENIKELKNVKNYGNFKIFAIEGVTVSSQLEFIYTLELSPSRLGAVVVQKNYKVNNAEVIIRKPSTYKYRIKSYNKFPEMEIKKVDGNKEALTAVISNIEAMTDEGSASTDANRMKVAYQVTNGYLDNDTTKWDNLENNIRTNFILIKPSKYKSLIKHYSKFIKDKPRETNTQIINTICNYIYSNYNIKKGNDYNLSNLRNIVTKKQATEQGIIKLFSCLLNYENIDYQIGLTSNRYYHKFDKNFFSNLNLQVVLLYFPKQKKYITPSNYNSRLNFAPKKTITNYGVFIGKHSSDYKKIAPPKATENTVERSYLIEIDTVNTIPKVTCKHKLTGYRASNSRYAYKYYKNKDLNKYKGFTAVSGIEDFEFSNFEVLNDDISLTSKNIPYKLNYSYKAESLIEDLGNDFLLNFGKVIGTQGEFYQEAERVNPVEISALITYSYVIKIKIPEGYEIKNIEDAEINKALNIDNDLACSFVSKAKIEKGFAIITATEIYNKIHMELQYYDGYKDVVNAAFDFSKKSLLLKKI